MRNNERKYYHLRAISLEQRHKDFLVGTLLGDGCLAKGGKKSDFRLSFSHCEKQKDYFLWKFDFLKPFTNNFYKSIDKRGNSIMYQTKSICHPELNKYAKMFYDSSRRKIIPKDIESLLTPLGLAIWIMDDGNLNEKVNLRICSMGFNYSEHHILQKALKNKFGIDCIIREYKYKSKLYYMLWFDKVNTIKFSNLIKNHIVESMKYKIVEPSETSCETPEMDEDKVRT